MAEMLKLFLYPKTTEWPVPSIINDPRKGTIIHPIKVCKIITLITIKKIVVVIENII